MKKIIGIAAIAAALALSGCESTADLVSEKTPEVSAPAVSPLPSEKPEEPKTTIPLTSTLKMTNDWTIMGDCNISLTEAGKKDRIVLATSAKNKNGEMQWDDMQSWTLAVISEQGAYNLFTAKMQGIVFFEVNECFVRGVSTDVVTAYVFSGTDREVRNYFYDAEKDLFTEEIAFSTTDYSTGGINNLYSCFPEYKAK